MTEIAVHLRNSPMRQLVACSSLAVLLIVAASSQQCDACPPAPHSETLFDEHPWFSCDGGCAPVLNDAIALARESILVKGYRIGPRQVRRALDQAEAAGVNVRTITEHGPSQYAGSAVPQDSRLDDPNYVVDRPEVVVIDKRQVITVFFRSSSSHRRSVASLFVIRDSDLARFYLGH